MSIKRTYLQGCVLYKFRCLCVCEFVVCVYYCMCVWFAHGSIHMNKEDKQMFVSIVVNGKERVGEGDGQGKSFLLPISFI